MPEVSTASPTHFDKFFLLEKYDAFKGIATGIATAEQVDRDKEILDYAKSKPFFEAWSESVHKDSGGKSVGNLRLQHDDKKVAGRLNEIEFNDDAKMIRVEALVIDPVAKELLKEGALTGFSIGGRYVEKTPQSDGTMRYVADPCEISVVDRPALPGAVFQSVKADGSIELRKFAKYIPHLTDITDPGVIVDHPVPDKPGQDPTVVDAEGNKDIPIGEPDPELHDGTTKAVRYLVPDGQHLPVTGEDGKPDHHLMGAAWAALHGGYRGNKYEGPDKGKALHALTALYHSEGMDTPATKAISVALDIADAVDMVKALDIETSYEQISDLLKSLQQALTEKIPMADELKLDKAARHSIHQKIDAAKAQMDNHLEHCMKAHKAMHAHLDGLKKVLGGGPESMDEAGKPDAVTEGMSPSGSPAMPPGASDTASKGIKYVFIGKNADGLELFKAVDPNAPPPTAEEIAKSVVKSILEIQKASVDAIGDRSKVTPFVKAATKQHDVTTTGAAGGEGAEDPNVNKALQDPEVAKRYAQGDPDAVRKVQSATAGKWQPVPSRMMNEERYKNRTA